MREINRLIGREQEILRVREIAICLWTVERKRSKIEPEKHMSVLKEIVTFLLQVYTCFRGFLFLFNGKLNFMAFLIRKQSL